jgi:hypothetical protein
VGMAPPPLRESRGPTYNSASATWLNFKGVGGSVPPKSTGMAGRSPTHCQRERQSRASADESNLLFGSS